MTIRTEIPRGDTLVEPHNSGCLKFKLSTPYTRPWFDGSMPHIHMDIMEQERSTNNPTGSMPWQGPKTTMYPTHGVARDAPMRMPIPMTSPGPSLFLHTQALEAQLGPKRAPATQSGLFA